MKRLCHAVLGLVVVTVLVGLNAGVAVAAPPPSLVGPFDCLREFDENPYYVSDGWVRARVADVAGILLGCGDERSGVIHIAHPESNGHVHPIPPGAENLFLWCFDKTIRAGKQRPDDDYPESRTRFEYTYYGDIDSPFPVAGFPQKATAIVDNSGRFVWTFFTSSNSSSPRGNNWGACAGDMA